MKITLSEKKVTELSVFRGCKSLKELVADFPILVINTVKKEIQNLANLADIDCLPRSGDTVQNILKSTFDSPSLGRMKKITADYNSAKNQQKSDEEAADFAIKKMLNFLAEFIYENVRTFLKINETKEMGTTFIECARAWHTQTLYKEFSTDEVKDAFNLAAKKGMQIYQSFGVVDFYAILNNYLDTRRSIICAISKVENDLKLANEVLTNEEIACREKLAQDFINQSASEIEQATKINYRWRRKGKLRMPNIYCRKVVLNELIKSGVLPKEVVNDWSNFLKNFATTETNKNYPTFGDILAEHKKPKELYYLESGMNWGINAGWAVDFKTLCFDEKFSEQMLEKAQTRRDSFLDLAKVEFIHNLYWTVIQPYTDPKEALRITPVYELSEAQANAKNWQDFCAVSLQNYDFDLLVNYINNCEDMQDKMFEFGVKMEDLDILFFNKLKDKPLPKYTVTNLLSFLLGEAIQFFNNIEYQREKTLISRILKNPI